MSGPGVEPIASAPPLLLLGFIAYLVAVAGTALAGVSAGLRRAGVSEQHRLRIGRLAGASLAAWFLLLAMTSVSGLYLEEPARPRFLWYVAPALVAVVALFRARWLRAAVVAMPTWWIPAFQTLRLGGGMALFAAWAIGLAPWGLARTAGSFDLLVGGAAAGVALALFRGVPGSLGMGLLWNGLGLGDILHTLYLAVASAPGPQRLLFEEPANRIAAVFPFLYLPGFIVPLTILLHLLSLRQLLAAGVRR
ncbi:MAG: hypothetical protein ACLPJH_08135 [Myxococcaceae bacterium]